MREQGVKHTIKHNSTYFLTLTVVGWADVFTRMNHKQAIVNALRYCIAQKGLELYAFCLMTNHLHIVARCNPPFHLRDTIRDFKRYTARTILAQIIWEPESRRSNFLSQFREAACRQGKGATYKFWKTGNHAIELNSEKFFQQKIRYLHKNPVTARFVKKPEHWIYSSASNYRGLKSIVPEVTIRSSLTASEPTH